MIGLFKLKEEISTSEASTSTEHKKKGAGGKRPGGGRPKGLKHGEKLYDQIQMAVPVPLAPSIKTIITEWKKIYKKLFDQTGKIPQL